MFLGSRSSLVSSPLSLSLALSLTRLPLSVSVSSLLCLSSSHAAAVSHFLASLALIFTMPVHVLVRITCIAFSLVTVISSSASVSGALFASRHVHSATLSGLALTLPLCALDCEDPVLLDFPYLSRQCCMECKEVWSSRQSNFIDNRPVGKTCALLQ